VKAVFGDHARKALFGSSKSMTGHLPGGAAASNSSCRCWRPSTGKIPRPINQVTPDPDCDLDSAPNTAVERPVRVALSNSFGFGGHNVTLAVRAFRE
jgi:3-oxoacyl-(acyl-carrier-protein) synthase